MAVFFKSLQVNSFRGIRQLSVDNLNHINIIVGDNNSGKTSVLEALMLLKNPKEFSNVLRASRLRELSLLNNTSSHYESFINMFPRNNYFLEISLSANYINQNIELRISGDKKMILIDPLDYQNEIGSLSENRKKQIKLLYADESESECFSGSLNYKINSAEYNKQIKFYPFSSATGREISKNNLIDMFYLSPIDHIRNNVFTRIISNDSYKDICVHVLRLFDPEIKDLIILKNDIDGRPVEYVKHSALGNMPLSTYGDGIKKVLSLANGISQAAGGVLLIDEIETAIHSKYYHDIFSFVIKACKQFNVQTFITTHSLEAIDGLLETQGYDKQQNSDDITVLTIKKDYLSGKSYSRILDGRHVYKNREQFGFEVRL